MASSLRAQYSQQFVQDMNTFDNAVQKAETYYNNAQMSQVQTKANQVYFDYQQEIKQTDDFTQYEAIQSKYQAQIDDYLNEIKASPKVRKQWYENYQPEMDLNMQKFRADSEVKGMYTKAELGWEGYVDVVGSDTSMTLDQKISALVEYHTKNQVESIPETIVGQKLSIDEAKTQMVYASAQQGVTNYYANKDNNINAVDFNKDAVFQYVLSELTDAEGNSYVTENEKANVNTIIQNQIDKMEEQAKAQAKTNQENFSTYYTELRNKGQNLNDEDIVMMASQYGAYNPDGSINRFWAPWFESYSKAVEAINDFNTTLEITKEDQFIKSLQGQGEFYTSESKTYTYNGVTVTTEYGGIVNAILDHFDINASNEKAVKQVISLVENLGSTGYFLSPDMQEDIKLMSYWRANPNITGSAYASLIVPYRAKYDDSFLSKYDLLSPSTKAWKDMLNQNPSIEALVKESVKGNSSKLDNEKYYSVMKYLEVQFNSDPSIVADTGSVKFKDALKNATELATSKTVSKAVNKAYQNISNNEEKLLANSKVIMGNIPVYAVGDENMADNANLQKAVKPFYDTDDDSYALYQILLPDDVYATLSEEVFKDKKITEDISEEGILNSVSQSIFGIDYNSLPKDSAEQTTVKLGVARYIYERDFTKNIVEGLDISEGNAVLINAGNGILTVYDLGSNKWYMPSLATDSKDWYIQGTGNISLAKEIREGKTDFTLEELGCENYTKVQSKKK